MANCTGINRLLTNVSWFLVFLVLRDVEEVWNVTMMYLGKVIKKF